MSKIGNYNLGEIEKRDAIIQEMLEILYETQEHIAGELDADGHADGSFTPNRAMRISMAIDEVLEKIEHSNGNNHIEKSSGNVFKDLNLPDSDKLLADAIKRAKGDKS